MTPDNKLFLLFARQPSVFGKFVLQSQIWRFYAVFPGRLQENVFMIFKRSLVSEFTNTAGGVFTVLFSIVLTVALVRILARVNSGSYDQGSILQIVLYSALTYLAPLLAMSLFIAILIALIRSWQQNEMVVWFSSGGLSLLAWLRPVIRFSIPIVLLTALVSLVLAPWARNQMEVNKSQFSQRDDTAKVASGQFIESQGGKRVFFIEQADEDQEFVKGIFVSENRGDKRTIVVAREGRLMTNDAGDRYVELKSGRRYVVPAQKPSFQITEFDKYGIRLDIKPDQALSVNKAQALTTDELWKNRQDPKSMGQLFWRLSWPFVALNLALLAIPLSFSNPRAGRSLNLVVAVLIYILYLNSVSAVQTMITNSRLTWVQGMLAVHGAVLLITTVLFIRRIWFQRWLPPQLSIGYWRTRGK